MIGITGANGFIGKKLCEGLAQRGIDFVPFQGRLDDIDGIREFFSEGVSLLVHLAGKINERNVRESVSANLISTRNLISVSKENPIKGILYASSCAVYQLSESPVAEDGELDLDSCYAATKMKSEHLIRQSNLGYCILRPSSVYGGGKGVIDIFNRKFINGEPITLIGPGNTFRDFLHISDAVNYILAGIQYIEEGGTGDIFNVGSDCVMSLNDVIDEMTTHYGVSPVIERINSNRAYGSLITNSSKARKTLGYSPRHNSLRLI